MANYANYYEIIVDHLDAMKFNKEEEIKNKNQYKHEILKIQCEAETLENEIFLKMLDLAWQNCEDKKKAISELDKFYSEIRSKFNEAQVLKQARVAYQLLTDTAINEFKKDKETYVKALKALALKLTESFINSNGQERVHDLVPIERRFDEFGSWEIDRFFAQMKVFLILPTGRDGFECFPVLWRTDKNDTNLEVEERSPKDVILNESKSAQLTLNVFLERELSVEDPKQLNQIIETFRLRNIFTLTDLTEIRNWVDLSNILPAQWHRLQNAVERHRNSKVMKKVEKQKTQAEVLGDWNKAKLFLLHEANLSDFNLPGMIDFDALEKGFEEQRKDPNFDGGPSNNCLFFFFCFFFN